VGDFSLIYNVTSNERMLYDYLQAICAIYPYLAIEMQNPSDFSTIKVQNANATVDKALLDAWIEQKNEIEPAKLLRKERDKRLQEVDWIVNRAYSSAQPVPTEWATYMQALRDLPSTSTPTLNEAGQLDMSSVDWPVKPTSS
jgi:hypothetical protein